MCLAARRSLDPKTRRILVTGQLSLVAANLLFLFGQPFAHLYPGALDALRGFLLGLAIVFLFWSNRRNCSDAESHA
ncbi:MAG: hypothetical protein ABSF28_00790 [Terracidiphilus sp.]|jgi:uncharacterized membrane protein YccC